jgi:hypothetical protein
MLTSGPAVAAVAFCSGYYLAQAQLGYVGLAQAQLGYAGLDRLQCMLLFSATAAVIMSCHYLAMGIISCTQLVSVHCCNAC